MKSDAKKTKNENPLVLNAEVGLHRPGHGLAKLGEIIGTSKSILTVKWETGDTEYFGRKGQSFYGKLNAFGEPVGSRQEDLQIWGGEEDPPSHNSKFRF